MNLSLASTPEEFRDLPRQPSTSSRRIIASYLPAQQASAFSWLY